MGITKGILDASVAAAEEAGATRISEIRISVGELTEIVDDALQFAFEALSPGTMAEDAVLTVTFLPAQSHCLECDTHFEHGRFDMVCPECGSFMLELETGRELRIDSIETDDVEADSGQEATTSNGAGE